MHHLIRLVLGFIILLIIVALVYIIMMSKTVAIVVLALFALLLSYAIGDFYFG